MSQNLQSDDDSKTYAVPELPEFQQLLSTIDTESQQVYNNNNTNTNHVTNDVDIKINEAKNINKEEERS